MIDKKLVPQIRFKGFSDAWEQRKLGEIVNVKSGKDYKHLNFGEIPVYGTGGYMLSVDSALSYNEDSIGIGRKGTIDNPYILRAPFWTVDTLFYCIPKNGFDLKFVYGIYQKINWKSKDESTGVPSLAKSTITSVNIKSPNLQEQQRIGIFFNQIDSAITLQQLKLDKLETLKRALLQQLFPKKDAKAPAVRFAGFTADWEQCKLGELTSERTEKSKNGELLSVTMHDGIKKFTSLDKKDNSSTNKSNYKVVKIGDIAYNSMRMWQGANGLSLYDGIVSPAYTVLKLKSDLSGIFTSYLFKRTELIWLFRTHSQGLTSDTWNLKYPALSQISVTIPAIQEQDKISDLLVNFDKNIEFQNKKIDILKNIKTALLQKLFV